MWRIYFEPLDFTGYSYVSLDIENFQEIDARYENRGFPYVTVTDLSEMDGMMYDGAGGLTAAPALPPEPPTVEEQIAALTLRVEALEA